MNTYHTSQENTTEAHNVSPLRTALSWIMSFIISFIMLILFFIFIGRVYYIPSGSMKDTLQVGDQVFAEKITYYNHNPQVGDVVIFITPEEWNIESEAPQDMFSTLVGKNHTYMIKRIVAQGGDTVRCVDGDTSIMVNDKPVIQDTVKNPPERPLDPKTESEACSGKYFDEITVPEGRYFVLGDNRTNSADSRYHLDVHNGTISEDSIVGKAQAIILPLNRITTDI